MQYESRDISALTQESTEEKWPLSPRLIMWAAAVQGARLELTWVMRVTMQHVDYVRIM